MNPEQHIKNRRPYLCQLRSEFMIHPWESAKEKTTADQKYSVDVTPPINHSGGCVMVFTLQPVQT